MKRSNSRKDLKEEGGTLDLRGVLLIGGVKKSLWEETNKGLSSCDSEEMNVTD